MRGTLRYAAAVILTVLLLAAPAAAQQVSGYPGREWVMLVLYAGTLGLILLLLAMLVRALRGAEPDEELVRMLTIFLVIMIAVFSLAGGVQWLGRVSGIDGMIYQRAVDFTDEQLRETLTTYAGIALLYSSVELIASLDLQIISLGGPLKPVIDLIGRLLDFAYLFLMSISLHKVLLEFGHRYAMSTLFPVGVVLWVFPWTRKAGSLLVAVALTLWLVFPFSVVLILQPTAELVIQDPEDFLELPLSDQARVLIDLLTGQDFPSLRELSEALSGQGSVTGIPGLEIISEVLLKEIVERAFIWWAQSFIVWLLVPVINIAFLMAMVSSIAEAIGGEGSPFSRVARYIFPR